MAVSPPGPSLRGADLRSVDLSQNALDGVDLRGADLRAVDLRGRDLRRALLSGADLRGARLDGAQLAGVDLSDAELDDASLAGADASGADLRRTRGLRLGAEGLRAPGARLEGAEWRSARLVGADLTDVYGTGWRADGADLTGARCCGARLGRAVLDDASIDGADFEGARLVGVAFVGARGYPRMARAVLDGADLRVDQLERFMGEGVRLVGARIRLGEVGPLEARLRDAGWRPTPMERVALRAMSSGAGLPQRAAALGRSVLPAARKGRAASDQGPAPKVLPEPLPAGAEQARAAQTEAEQARRLDVERRARGELRAQAVRRAMATRVATERGLRRAGAWAAQVGAKSRTWKDAIIGRPEEEAGPDIEGGLGFPVAAEVRDAAVQQRRSALDDRRRLQARRARDEAYRRHGGAEGLRARLAEEARAAELTRIAAEEAERARIENERLVLEARAAAAAAREAAERAEAERLREAAARAEGERRATAERAEAERLEAARGAAERAEAERLREAAERADGERRAAEARRREAERSAAEREEQARQREAARAARAEAEREAAAARAQARMAERIEADAARRRRAEAWHTRQQRLRAGLRAAARELGAGGRRVRALAVPPAVAAARAAATAALHGARAARHLGRRGWEFLGTPTAPDRTAALAIEAEFATDAQSRERRYLDTRHALATAARLRVAAARREQAAAERSARLEEGRARAEAERMLLLAEAGAREAAAREAREPRPLTETGAPAAGTGAAGGRLRAGARTLGELVFLLGFTLLLRVIVGWRATKDSARAAAGALERQARSFAGRSSAAVTRLRVAATAVTGLDEPEETAPSDAEVAEFRRESAARDRAGLDFRLDLETRSRLKVRRVRRDGEAARIALAARAEALGRTGRRDTAQRTQPAWTRATEAVGLGPVAEGLFQRLRRLNAAPPLPLGPGVDLRGRDLADRDLAGADLPGALLDGANLVGANLRGANLRGAELRRADLTAARLDGATLDEARLEDAIFYGAELAGASLVGADVTGTRFDGARGLDEGLRAELAARGAVVDVVAAPLLGRPGWGELRRLVVGGARAAAAGAPLLAGRVLGGVRRFREALPAPDPVAVGPGADLRARQLDEQDLAGVDLREANLAGAGLVGADLRNADLRGADLRGADLTAARLDGANLEGAFLEGAILDQAELAGANLDGAHVERALLADTLGLTRAQRRELAKRGADFGEGREGVWVRATSWALAASVFLVIGVYLGARYISTIGPDVASLEHAAGEAAREGNPEVASQRFAELAGAARQVDQKVDFLLEAASAAIESGSVANALDLLAQAQALAAGTSAEPQVLLRTAEAQAQAGLTSTAVDGFRALCQRKDLSPTQEAAALVGLARLLPDDAQAEIEATETALLARAVTDPERAALGMAVADSWSSVGRSDAARAAMERALGAVRDPAEVVPLQIRLARVLADDGDSDGALTLLRALIALPGGKGDEGRLGAAELLARRGAIDEATEVLAPILTSDDVDLRARGELASSTLAEFRGDTAGAIDALRRVLATSGLESHVMEEARLSLARILVKTDPEAAKALVGENAELRDEVRLGQARALHDAGKAPDARALWVEIADDPLSSDQARMEAELSIAEVEAQDNDVDAALRRYDRLMSKAVRLMDRQRIQLGAANAMVRGGRLQDAEARYQAMLNTNPGGDIADQCRLGLAQAAELRGQTEHATELYTEVGRSQGSWSMEALYALGRMRERLGDFPSAVGAYRLAQARPAGDPARRNEVAVALARAMQDAGDPGAADAYARLLEAPDPAVRVAARLAVGDSLVSTDAQRARTLYEEALAETPAGAERQHARAGWLRASVALGDVQTGMDRVRAWLETETDDALRGELAVQTVIALRAEGRVDDALAIGERYATDGGFELGMERASLLRDLGRPRDAAALLASLTPIGGEDLAWRAESEADAWIAASQYGEAERVLAELEKSPGGEVAAGFLLARVARERGDYDKALSLLSTSEDARAPAERATVLEALERWEEAETAWRRLALASDLETRSAAVLGLARAALARDDTAGALRELDALAAVDPGYALTLAEVKGDALLAAGRVDEARVLYAALVTDAEARTVGALGQGECDLASDDATSAVTRFTDALAGAVDPVYRARALGGLARAQLEAGDRAAAEATLKRLKAEHPEASDVLAEVHAALGGG